MKSLILYGSPVKLTHSHKRVTVQGQPDYYVRADLFNGDYPEAMDKAKPMVGEIVLNTVPIPNRETILRWQEDHRDAVRDNITKD